MDEVYNSNETSKLEFESLGYHLQHHPVDENLWELEQISPVKIKDLVLGKIIKDVVELLFPITELQQEGALLFLLLWMIIPTE